MNDGVVSVDFKSDLNALEACGILLGKLEINLLYQTMHCFTPAHESQSRNIQEVASVRVKNLRKIWVKVFTFHSLEIMFQFSAPRSARGSITKMVGRLGKVGHSVYRHISGISMDSSLPTINLKRGELSIVICQKAILHNVLHCQALLQNY